MLPCLPVCELIAPSVNILRISTVVPWLRLSTWY